VNGNNRYTYDNDSYKDFCGKLLFTGVEGLNIGGSFYRGKSRRGRDTLRTNRYGVEVDYKKGPFWIRGECLSAKDEYPQMGGIGDIGSIGYYVVFAYKFLPYLEGVTRYDVYDPNIDTEKNEWTNITIGVNIWT
jgi:hypothetical protein